MCLGHLDVSWSLQGSRAAFASTGLAHKEAETSLPKERTAQRWIWGYGSDGCISPHHASSMEPQSADLILGGARQKYSGEEWTKNKSCLFLALHILRESECVPFKHMRSLSWLAWWLHGEQRGAFCCGPLQLLWLSSCVLWKCWVQRNSRCCVFRRVCSDSVSLKEIFKEQHGREHVLWDTPLATQASSAITMTEYLFFYLFTPCFSHWRTS